jgi:transposase
VKDGKKVGSLKDPSRKHYTPMEDELSRLKKAKCEYLKANGGRLNKVFGYAGKGKGVGYEKIAKKYKLSTSTLVRFVKKGLSNPPGRPGAMSEEEEAVLAGLIKVRANWGFALSFSKLKRIVETYMKARFEKEMEVWVACGHAREEEGHPKPYFHGGSGFRHTPGRWWMRNFIFRHRELTTRLAENRRMAYSSVTKELIEE